MPQREDAEDERRRPPEQAGARDQRKHTEVIPRQRLRVLVRDERVESAVLATEAPPVILVVVLVAAATAARAVVVVILVIIPTRRPVASDLVVGHLASRF